MLHGQTPDPPALALQSFLSRTCVRTASPQFEAENNMVITREGAHTLHCVVHRVKYLDAFRHDPVGIASIDLLQCFHAASARQAPGAPPPATRVRRPRPADPSQRAHPALGELPCAYRSGCRQGMSASWPVHELTCVLGR